MALSGMHWTMDIGRFFTVNEKWQNRGGADVRTTHHPNGSGEITKKASMIMDIGELYVRWFEFAAFLPMFRSHGTDTPRKYGISEIPENSFYDALVSTIQLRYRLMPYIYSMAGRYG